MPNIHIHTFSKTHLMSSVLCNEHSIEYLPPRLSLFIALYSVANHYLLPMAPGAEMTSNQFFSGHHGYHTERFNMLKNNKEKVNYACDLVKKPHIFTDF